MDTCVLSRHSRKYFTLLKLRTELKTNCSLLGHIFLKKKNLKSLIFHTSLTVIAFDQILTLRARHTFSQLVINCHTIRPYTLCGTTVSEGFFLKCLAIFFRQDNINQKYKTHPVKSYFTKQLLFTCL